MRVIHLHAWMSHIKWDESMFLKYQLLLSGCLERDLRECTFAFLCNCVLKGNTHYIKWALKDIYKFILLVSPNTLLVWLQIPGGLLVILIGLNRYKFLILLLYFSLLENEISLKRLYDMTSPGIFSYRTTICDSNSR